MSAACGICLDPLVDATEAEISGCEHHYCFDCILFWSKTANTCPACRVRFHTIKGKHDRIFRIKKKNVDPTPQMYEHTLQAEEQAQIELAIRLSMHGYELDNFVVADEYLSFEDDDSFEEEAQRKRPRRRRRT